MIPLHLARCAAKEYDSIGVSESNEQYKHGKVNRVQGVEMQSSGGVPPSVVIGKCVEATDFTGFAGDPGSQKCEKSA